MPQTGNIVQWIFDLVDNYLIHNVASTVSRMIEVSVPLVVVASTLMFLFYGWSIMRGAVNEPVLDLVGRVTRMAIIVSFATAGGLYQTVVMEIVLTLPNDAVTAVTSSDGHTMPQRMDEGLNTSALLASKVKDGSDIWNPFYALGNLLLAFVFVVAGALVSGLGLVTLLTVKVATALLTALGPAFILCLIFESTKGLFDRWVHQIINYMLLAVLFAILMELILTIQGEIMRMSLGEVEGGDFNLFQLLTVYLLFIFGVVFLLFQLPSMAASLAGGFGLQISGAAARSIASPMKTATRMLMPGRR